MSGPDPTGRPGVPLSCIVGLASMVGAVALCTIVGGFPGSRSVIPILATTVAGAVVTGALLWSRRSSATGVLLGATAVLLSATATTVPGATWFGIPTATTYRVLHRDASAAKASLRAPGIPYHAVPVVVLLAAVVAGMLALLAQVILISARSAPSASTPPATTPPATLRPADRRLMALVPSFGLVVWAAAVGSVRAATGLTAGFVMATVILLALPGRDEGPSAQWGGGRAPPHGAAATRLTPAFLLAAVAVAALVVAGASVGAASSTGGSNAAGSNGPTSELRLLSSVVALERRNPSTVVFTAVAPVPTYWEVGALTQYRDGTWLPSPALAAEAGGRTAPVAGRSVLPTRTSGRFEVQVTLDNLSGRLVPLPPDTVSVDAPFGVVRTAAGTVSLGDLTGSDRYSAAATVPRPVTASPDVTGTSDPGTGLTPAQVAAFTALPALPSSIHTLAAGITSGADDPVTRALLLENWLRSGTFHYSLSPPALPTGTAGLVDFLTSGHTGTCQQFAGAFAVLARSIGLPTRVMVGFTTGLRSSAGTTTVRGADAHAWPQVYLGPAAGWVSFEPTPSRPSGESTPPDVVGPTRITAPPPRRSETPTTVPTGSTVPTTVPTGPSTTVGTTVPTTAPVTTTTSSKTTTGGTGPGTATGSSRTGRSAGGWAVTVLTLAAVLVGPLMVFRRRRRRAGHGSWPGSDYPPGPVGEAWRSIDRSMFDAGVPRAASLSPVAFGRRLHQAMERYEEADRSPAPPAAAVDRVRSLVADVAVVADLLERSVFGGEPIGGAAAADVAGAAQRVHQATRQPGVGWVLRDMVRPIGAPVVSMA